MPFKVPYPRTYSSDERSALARVDRDFEQVSRELGVIVPFPRVGKSMTKTTAARIDRNFAALSKAGGRPVPFTRVYSGGLRNIHRLIDRNFYELEPLGRLLYPHVYAGTSIVSPNAMLPNHGVTAGTTVVEQHYPPPPPPYIILEDFETYSFPGPFTVVTGGTWEIVDDGTGNHVLAKTAGGEVQQSVFDGPFSELVPGTLVRMSMRVRANSSGTNLTGLHFGRTSGTDGYQVVIDRRNGTGSSAAFQIRNNWSNAVSDPSPTIVSGDWYTIVVEWDFGVSMECWLYDDTNAQIGHMATSATQRTGQYIGVINYGTGLQGDDLSAEIIPPPAPQPFPTTPDPGTQVLFHDFDDGTTGPLVTASGGTWGTIATPIPYNAGFSLAKTAGGNAHQVLTTTATYGSPDTLHLSSWVSFRGAGTLLSGIHFGGQSGANGYQVLLDSRNGSNTTAALQIRTNTSSTIAYSTGHTNTLLQWYWLSVTWTPGVSISVDVYDESMTIIDTLSVNTSLYSTGTVGTYSYGNGTLFDNFRVATLP